MIALSITVWIIIEMVCGKVITINNNGRNITECCEKGMCLCSSINAALSSINNNTVVTITSKMVPLTVRTLMGSGNLHNITITGNGATIMCNNSGGVYCESCSDVIIEGITWDQCSDPNTPKVPGIEFRNVADLLIAKCTFQWFQVCISVSILDPTGNVSLIDSVIQYNNIKNVISCSDYNGDVLIWNTYRGSSPSSYIRGINLIVSGSLFYYNRHFSKDLPDTVKAGSLIFRSEFPNNTIALIENTMFLSNGIPGMYFWDTANSSIITLFNVTVTNNSNGGLTIISLNESVYCNVISSNFRGNNNGALRLDLQKQTGCSCNVSMTNFTENKGGNNITGVALYINTITDTIDIGISYCKFHNNTGGNSIVYAALNNNQFVNLRTKISMTSCSFTDNKIGSALYVAKCFLSIYNSNLFQNNLAESGAALYFQHNSQVSVSNNASAQFANNTASVYGGAIYADLGNCLNHGVLFKNISDYNSITFVNNSARVSGNSIYFNIPASCEVIRNETSNDSIVHIPNKFVYIQRHGTIGPAVTTSPYEIKVCSPADCSVKNNNRSTCLIEGFKMFGYSIAFNATVCGYYNTLAETVQFRMQCINCSDSKYQLIENEILAYNGSSNNLIFLAKNAVHDLMDAVNVTLDISSVISHQYKQISAKLSLTLSSCYSGFVFGIASQQCECYKHDKDIVLCDEDQAEIKQGYWFGAFPNISTVSICPYFYCNFVHRIESRTGYFILPPQNDEQCSPHRTGPACGECIPGYSLSYDTPDCVSDDQCSVGMTALVIVLTVFYWVAVIVIVIFVMYRFNSQISLGHLHGIIYFYSIVDIILVDKLYVSDGVFYTVSLLSSFAKLTPKVYGKLCFLTGLDATDQQFIHYSHVACIWFILAVILIIARYCNTVAAYINRSSVLVTGLFLLLSYTSLASTSLQLLRALQYNNVDEVYVYLSPRMKYFTNRHAVYGSIALVCCLVIVLGFPVLLLAEPFLKQRKVTFKKIESLVNWFNDCYTEKYRWFAPYYLICRLVIMLIVYFVNSDYSNMIYCLQTACVIIAMTHVLIRPYKTTLFNTMDTMVLLTLLLVVNLSAFDFSQPLITGIVVVLILFPLCMVLAVGIFVLFKHHKIMQLFNFTTGVTNDSR